MLWPRDQTIPSNLIQKMRYITSYMAERESASAKKTQGLVREA